MASTTVSPVAPIGLVILFRGETVADAEVCMLIEMSDRSLALRQAHPELEPGTPSSVVVPIPGLTLDALDTLVDAVQDGAT
jgi:hypothetical protein